MADEVIKESDLIQSDGSIDRLVQGLEELNKNYTILVNAVRASAKEIVHGMTQASTATAEGRKEIDLATISANRLERATKELLLAQTENGRQIAWLKAQTQELNRETVKNQQQIRAAEGSYDRLNSELREHIELWNALTPAERASADMGGQIAATIKNLRAQIKGVNEELNPAITKLTELQKAEERLAYLQSAEGQQLIAVKRQISDILSGRSAEKEKIDEVARAAEKLAYVRSEEYAEVQKLNQQIREEQRIAKLTAQANNSATGSYNQLAATYELNKIKLNAMSHEERYATEAGKDLEEQTLNIYKQMIRLQEATGNHRLSVGNYKLAWNGLGNAMNQVIRELPAATMGINTFFLAISNNIPVLIDEIDRVRQKNKLLAAEGKATQSVIKTITGAIFSWQTALILCLTALSMHGKEILAWITKVIKGRAEAIKYADAIDNVNKELKSTNDSYGQNITTFKKLSDEWKKLSTQKEQLQWIRDNKSEFDKLDVSVKNVNDAENIFVDHTHVMVSALKARAKAAAAMKLAADNYEEALIKQAEAEAELAKGTSPWDEARGMMGNISTGGLAPAANVGQQMQEDAENYRKQRIQNLRDEQKALEDTADQYYKMAEAILETSKKELEAAGIDSKHKDKKELKGRQPKDLTDRIWRNDLQIRKKYELSISQLQRDEFRKRKIEAVDQANQTIREMQEKFRKNEVFLNDPDGKFKDLSPEQIAQIQKQQDEIAAIIKNTQTKLSIDLQHIEDERQINSLQTLRQALSFRIKAIEGSIEKERALKIKQIEDEEERYRKSINPATVGQPGNGNTADELIVTSATPEQIAAFKRQKEVINAQFDQAIYNMRKADIEAELELVKAGTEQELELLRQRNEAARRLALAENRLKPVEQRVDESKINKQFDQRGKLEQGSQQMVNFDQTQAADEAKFNATKHNETQITIFKLTAEKERWEKLIALAKSGAIKWSDAQMKEAQETIKGLEREINEAGNMMNLISEKGLGGALLTKLGFDDDQIAALTEATNIIIENIQAITQAEVDAAQKAVEAAEERVAAAQKAYDAEVEARNNGYANNVANAKKELQQEKKNQMQKQKQLEEAQRRQEAINSVVQASSLITASANLWSSFSSIPIVGPALAIAAIAAMWTSFAVAKIKAKQVTSSGSQEYGEGGYEVLEGGSHASGNDIDLHTKNSKGKNMRAEGGEAMAIINKRSTRRYRKMLPQLISSLNKGTFEDKFIGAFRAGDNLAMNAVTNYEAERVNLDKLEDDVHALRRRGETQYFNLGDGTTLEVKGNVKRIYK